MTLSTAPFSVAIADILIGVDRVGFFNDAHARQLGQSMAAEGQRAPIQLRRNGPNAGKKWTLVAGLHRLRGAEHVGLTHIDAIQVADKSATRAELRRMELAENLSHRFRRPIERAIMMVELARLEEAADHPEHVGESRQARGGRLKNSASVTVTVAGNWRERAARAFGCSLSSFEKHCRLHKAIVQTMPDLAQAVNDHPLGESLSAVTTLAQIKADRERRAAAIMMLTRTDWLNMTAVLVAAGVASSNGFRVDPSNHRAVIGNTWSKMPEGEQRAFILDDLPGKLTRDLALELTLKLQRGFKL